LMFLPKWVVVWQIPLHYSLSSHIPTSSPFVRVLSLVFYPPLDILFQKFSFAFFFQFCNPGHRCSISHRSVNFNFHNRSASTSMLNMAGLCVRWYTIWQTKNISSAINFWCPSYDWFFKYAVSVWYSLKDKIWTFFLISHNC
jgi:hypothetical protein